MVNWLFASLILTNAFRSFLRDQVINPPKWWYHTIEEVANAPASYPIYIASNSITYYSIKQKSRYDEMFKALLEKITVIPIDQMFSVEKEMEFYSGKCASFGTSKVHESHKVIFPHEIVTEDIHYDNILDVRFVRKDFKFADKIVKL